MQGRSKKSLNTNPSMSGLGAQGNKGGSQFRLYIMFALIFLFVIGGVYSYFKMIKTMEFSPQKLFEQTFLEPVSSVTDLKGGSESTLSFDSWIRFKSFSDVHLIKAQEFKPYLAEVGRIAFAEKYAGDPSLQQAPSNYEYLVRTEHGIGKVVNEALLINKSTHEYFYRSWGM